MKMNALEKAARKENMRRLGELNGIVANDGVTTMVWWPEFPGSRMGAIAFSTCNEKDEFNRKFGEFTAFQNLANSGMNTLVRREYAETLFDMMFYA